MGKRRNQHHLRLAIHHPRRQQTRGQQERGTEIDSHHLALGGDGQAGKVPRRTNARIVDEQSRPWPLGQGLHHKGNVGGVG